MYRKSLCVGSAAAATCDVRAAHLPPRPRLVQFEGAKFNCCLCFLPRPPPRAGEREPAQRHLLSQTPARGSECHGCLCGAPRGTSPSCHFSVSPACQCLSHLWLSEEVKKGIATDAGTRSPLCCLPSLPRYPPRPSKKSRLQRTRQLHSSSRSPSWGRWFIPEPPWPQDSPTTTPKPHPAQR